MLRPFNYNILTDTLAFSSGLCNLHSIHNLIQRLLRLFPIYVLANFHRAVASKKTNWLVNWWSYIPPRRSLCTKVSAMDDGCASENGSHPDAKISKSYSYVAQPELHWWCWLGAFRTAFMTLGSCNDSNIKICHTYSCRMWMDWLRAPAGAKKYFIMCLHSSESLQISWRVFFKAFLQRTLAVWLDQCHHQCVCLFHVGSLTSSSSRCTTPLSWCFVSPSRYCLVFHGIVWCWIVLYGIVCYCITLSSRPIPPFLEVSSVHPDAKITFPNKICLKPLHLILVLQENLNVEVTFI